MATEQQTAELLLLWEKYAVGTSSEDDVKRLEVLARSDPELMQLFVDISHQHACLAMTPDLATRLTFTDNMQVMSDCAPHSDMAVPPPATNISVPGGSRLSTILRVAALLVAGIGSGYFIARSLSPVTAPGSTAIATLSETAQCQWAGGTLPTEQGATLPHGRLRLTSGLATITFTSGATVVMEGPVDMELLSPMKCRLHSGLVVAHVPTQAINFEIETPKARVFDLGTEFALSVNPQGDTQVRVIDGLVEAQPNRSAQRHPLTRGEAAIIENELDFRLEKIANREIGRPATSDMEPLSAATVRIATSDGNGNDAYIASSHIQNHDSSTLLLIKNGHGNKGCHRKIYLSFDLTRIKGSPIEQAVLQLAMEPSGFGAASGLSDSVFKVYGVTDENRDSWTANSINWDNAPANMPDGNAVDPANTVYLGSFTVPRGVQRGCRDLASDELSRFLNRDTNGRVTLIIVRETREKPAGDLVHAFASRRHPGAQPPTLQLKLKNNP